MPKPRLIAIDIDGTLLGSDGRVSDINRDAILAAEQAGVEVVIATGRRHAYAMRVLRDLGLRGAASMVSSNGTVIRTLDATLVRREHLSLETLGWLCREISEFRDTFVLTYDNVDETGIDRHGSLVCEESNILNTSIGRWMEANEPYMRRVARLEEVLPKVRQQPDRAGGAPRPGTPAGVEPGLPVEAQPGLPVKLEPALPAEAEPGAPIQAMLCGTLERMEAAYQRLTAHPNVVGTDEEVTPSAELVLHRTLYPERDLAILDILPAGCSKATALAYLADQRGCTMADVLAIGDNWNDLPMLKAAGQAVLMGNAPADLQALAGRYGWTVGATNDEDGVAQAIRAALV